MAKVLVLGATGYIGGRLVPRLLLQGHHVHCLAAGMPGGQEDGLSVGKGPPDERARVNLAEVADKDGHGAGSTILLACGDIAEDGEGAFLGRQSSESVLDDKLSHLRL